MQGVNLYYKTTIYTMKDDQLVAIPKPKSYPIIKNLLAMDIHAPVQSLMHLADQFGEIYQLELPTKNILLVNSQELVDEICDESRFHKKVHDPLEKIRDLAGDGLFTAYGDEPNWEKAHRILVPAFAPGSIKNMFGQMYDIADQMLLKWERGGEETRIDVSDNMTRLTLDTIALCAFDYRFNSFYQNEMHPFVGAMVNALHEAGQYNRRLPLMNKLMFLTKRNYEQEIKYLHSVAAEIIEKRKKQPLDQRPNDLLERMLTGKDATTGEGLSDENIIYQMVTFLIAGHETTSGLLSFALYFLLKHPEIWLKAQAMVDEVVGDEKPSFEHLARLPYIDQILKETLRIWPTAPVFGVYSPVDTVIGGKYPVKKNETVLALLPALHRDPKVWGNDVETFNPDRFATDKQNALPPNAYKPFGNGMRACIGRPFALQEAQLVLIMLLQRFDLLAADPNYQLSVKETLTLKPDQFYIRVKKRHSRPFSSQPTTTSQPQPIQNKQTAPLATKTATPLLVLYGSNSGSSQDFAQRIAADASTQGYRTTLGTLDHYVGNLPGEGAVVIVTASYEGQPTENARSFVAWLDSLQGEALKNLRFAVFGCGNSDWVRTYQAIPKKIDARLAALGGKRLVTRGEADAKNDFFGDFDRWYNDFWQTLGKEFGQDAVEMAQGKQYEVEVVHDLRAHTLREHGLQWGSIVENRELVDMSKPNARSKRHIEIALPAGMRYRSGDYLSVLPANAKELVDRALRRFQFDYHTHIIIRSAEQAMTTLPTDYPISVGELLTNYVELHQPATQKQVAQMAAATECPPEKRRLAQYAEQEAYPREVLAKRLSVLDLLEQFPACGISFQVFLEMLPAMKPRQYSISSSPLWNAEHCTLTVAVLDAPALSGAGRYRGIASNYLATAPVGSKVSVAVKPSQTAFHLPNDPQTPIILVGAGSGLAPFRGFLQERAIQIANGRQLGEALLFFGCDAEDTDFLYREELEEWERMGAVSVRTAFSTTNANGIAFVQDRIWQDRADVERLFRQGAIVYVCGDGKYMAPAVRATLIRVYQEITGTGDGAAEDWANEMERTNGRYVTDIFG